jgi:mevalonate kinase
LQELGVSSPEIDDIVASCMENEIHAKLTGAGGGGCVVCFPKDPSVDKTDLFKYFESKGYTVFDEIRANDEGLTYKINDSPLGNL